MPFRSHLFRSLDFRLSSNQLIAALVVVTAGAAVLLWVGGEPLEVFYAPIHAFLLWAIVREIDPDHQWTALAAGAVASAWVLAAGPVAPALPLAGLLIAGRVMTATTGRQLLSTDLAGVAVFGIVIGFTVAGWVAGFGIALALYLDDRRSPASRGAQVAASTITAVGTTVVASVARAFPDRLPGVIPYMAALGGFLALVLVAREPPPPSSRVDARYAAPLDQARLHISRATVGVLVFAMTVFTGADSEALVPLLAGLLLVVVSNELDRTADPTR